MIDNCLSVTAIGWGITGVGLLSTIVAAPAVIGMEAGSRGRPKQAQKWSNIFVKCNNIK